ncbi:hypothetical protein MUN78_06935 [Leucobacter allii]|uniref:Phage tail protein n=1 Tax=Leucobacter allii TaxID=2932247 RepID=A0ABY4FQL2_9MICO|nr:hypothetical protein [Leucobacter allii]UOQ58551.1 hypothetical protein MUN78_06935 [Leucobacter allii]
MSGTLVPDQGLKFLDIQGWWGLTPSRGRPDPLPGESGTYRRSTIRRDARAITIPGEIRTADNRELHAVIDRLTTALAAGAGRLVFFTPAAGQWERWVEIDRLDIDPDHGRSVTKFTIDVIAPDPRRYGPVQTVGPVGLPEVSGGMRLPRRFPWNFGQVAAGGRLLVPNAGSIPLMPRLLISGAFEAVAVRDVTAGRRLRLEWPVHEGETLVLDLRRRRAEIGSSEVTRWMTSRQWGAVEPGATHEFRFEVEGRIGSPQMTAQFQIGAP